MKQEELQKLDDELKETQSRMVACDEARWIIEKMNIDNVQYVVDLLWSKRQELYVHAEVIRSKMFKKNN